MSITISASRATIVPSASKPVRIVTCAPSTRVVLIAPSTSVVTLTGRPAAHEPTVASGSSLVYDFEP